MKYSELRWMSIAAYIACHDPVKQEDLGLSLSTWRTRKMVFLQEMGAVVPWTELLAFIAGTDHGLPADGRPLHLRPYRVFIFCSRGPAYPPWKRHSLMYRCTSFGNHKCLPHRVSIRRFRHLLEKHELTEQMLGTVNALLGTKGLRLRGGAAVDASLVAAPSSTNNKESKRDPRMGQTKQASRGHFGMKAHIGIDADPGAVHTVVGTVANVNDVTEVHKLLPCQERDVFADAGHQGVSKCEDTQHVVARWHVTRRSDKRRTPDRSTPIGQLLDELERVNPKIRAKVEHPFRIVKRQFDYQKVRYRGLAKNTAQLATPFALANLWLRCGASC